MSVADEKRREDKRRTLCLMLQHVGDLYVWQYGVEPTDLGFTDTLQTTWRELLDDNLIDDERSTMSGPVFHLTSHGWLRALNLSGAIDSAELRERCTKLAQALKAVIKGRKSHYDEFVSIDTLAASTGLPEGWIYNAIKSQLLGVVFPNDKWDAHLDQNSRRDVRVSPAFGLNHLFDE